MINTNSNFTLKPMDTAPSRKNGEIIQLLVLDEYQVMGKTFQTWDFVHWLDPWDGKPGGWYGRNADDLRNPIGWILATNELPTSF